MQSVSSHFVNLLRHFSLASQSREHFADIVLLDGLEKGTRAWQTVSFYAFVNLLSSRVGLPLSLQLVYGL